MVVYDGRKHFERTASMIWFDNRSALQTLHKVSAKAREGNYYQGGGTHGWVEHYESSIASDRSCLNEWHAMDCLETRRPPSPSSVRAKPTQIAETEKVIRSTLKEIMMSLDLDEVTPKQLRSRLEEELDVDLEEFRSFIDREMLVIMGQMDAPTEIFDHVYLGSEWNASNYDELRKNGVGHILNVTREIDNFFPGTFDYLNVRVYDDEKTDLLKHWDDTFKYITKAKNEGSKVLVHCKMGISRSASVVIAYAMKAYNWDFNKALLHVRDKRNCIKPNTNFLNQLETYQGILDAMKNKEKLQRSKSETNLKSPTNNDKPEKAPSVGKPVPIVQPMSGSYDLQSTLSGQNLRHIGTRPKSWSPDNLTTRELKEVVKSSPGFISLEDLSQKSASKESVQDSKSSLARHVLMPCDNGESYSASPNLIVHLPGHETAARPDDKPTADDPDVIETCSCSVSNLAKTAATWDPGETEATVVPAIDQSADRTIDDQNSSRTSVVCDENSYAEVPVWTSSAVIVTQSAVSSSTRFSQVPESRAPTATHSDPFSNQLDRVFDKEEKKQQRRATIPVNHVDSSSDDKLARECPSRQSSWSSYDSAVVMGFPDKHELSRHSSWGSADTRVLPSRNSSFSSYDMKPRKSVYYNNENGEKILHSSSDLQHNMRLEGATTRQLSSDSATSSCASLAKTPSSETLLFNFAEAINDTLIDRAKTTNAEVTTYSAISDKIDIPLAESGASKNSRLSVSAPEPCSLDLVTQECVLSRSTSNVSAHGSEPTKTSVKRQKSFLQKESPTVISKKSDEGQEASSMGKVQNLKKEFEAKSISTCLEQTVPETQQDNAQKPTKNRSLSSLPVCVHQPKENPKMGDDLNFDDIRSVFEKKKEDGQGLNMRQKYPKPNRNNTRSCYEMSVEKNSRPGGIPLISKLGSTEENEQLKRPPKVPAVKQIAATVIATAAKKQQQFGKTHPLARINIKPRHNNPVYNTM